MLIQAFQKRHNALPHAQYRTVPKQNSRFEMLTHCHKLFLGDYLHHRADERYSSDNAKVHQCKRQHHIHIFEYQVDMHVQKSIL